MAALDLADSDNRGRPSQQKTQSTRDGRGFLSDEPTLELIVKAKTGDATALEALMERSLKPLTRWAHGRLPQNARGHMDTGDLVQEAVKNAIQHLDTFVPRGVGAMQAYLRQSVLNRIRDEVRRVSRRGVTAELPEETASTDRSPLELAIAAEGYDRYRAALLNLTSRDRQLVVARVELEWDYAAIAERLRYRTSDGARVATRRALERLGKELSLAH